MLALLALRGMYGPRIGPRFLDDAGYIVAATAVAVMAITFARILFTGENVPGSQGLREWFFVAAFLTAGHAAVTVTETRSRRKHGGGRPTLIIGAGRVGHLLAKRLLASPEIGLRPVGFLDGAETRVRRTWTSQSSGDISSLEQTVLEHGVEHAIISFTRFPPEVELDSLQRLEQLGVSVSLVPRLFQGLPDRVVLERVGALPLVSIYPSISRGWQIGGQVRLRSRLALRWPSCSSHLSSSPPRSGVLASVGRPLLFRQRRVGLDSPRIPHAQVQDHEGQPDNQASLEAGWDAFAQGLAPGGVEGRRPPAPVSAPSCGEPRSTSCLSSLNVLRGEMSIVGPRPERPEYVEAFEERVHRYDLRHRVKAGITGWAQVHGLRGRTPLADRVEYDNYYIENWSLWLDVKILLLTVLAVFRGRSE